MGFTLVHQAMRQAKSDVREAASRVRVRRDQADRRMNAFLGSGWTGVAGESFVEAWDDWRAAAADVEEGLTAMAALLEAQHQDYLAQDEQSQQRLDALSARIIERLG